LTRSERLLGRAQQAQEHLLELQYSAAELDSMRAVKRQLDPGNILGRGTLLG